MASDAWLEAPDALMEAPKTLLEAPEILLGGGNVRTDGRIDRTKFPYSIGQRPLQGRCPKKSISR